MNNFLLSGSQSCQGLEVSEAARGTASSQTLLWAVTSQGSTLRGGGKATHPTFKYTCKFSSFRLVNITSGAKPYGGPEGSHMQIKNVAAN